ncbi:MAG: DUF4065 domain-containing protein [Planctomycetota bacterium]|nr:DUF4065 domain-containing protein [Planctomycetota bacterium]
MATVLDVARYILAQKGEMEAMKLQKLCYYAQAWHLAWESTPLFAEEFQAWRDGPVSRLLYSNHQRQRSVVAGQIQGSGDQLTEAQRCVVDEVLRVHGEKSGNDLSALTHREGPWCEARAGLAPDAHGDTVIQKDTMATYFRNLGKSRADWSGEPLEESLKRFIANRDDLLKRLA